MSKGPKEAKFTQKKRAEIAGGPSSGFATPVIGVNKEKKAKVNAKVGWFVAKYSNDALA